MGRRVLFIEGVPGSGKSTLTRLLEHWLQSEGYPVRAFYEGDGNHPGDYDGVSWFDETTFEQLCQIAPKDIDLMTLFDKTDEGYFIKYREHHGGLNRELLEVIHRQDIYELPIEKHMALMLSKWNRLSHHASFDDTIYIFECCLLQNPLTIGMIRDDMNKARLLNYINQIEELTRPFNPIVIYLNPINLNESFEKIMGERPSEWFDGFVSYYTQGKFGINHQLEGFNGVVKVLEERRKWEIEWLQSYKGSQRIVETPISDRSLEAIQLFIKEQL